MPNLWCMVNHCALLPIHQEPSLVCKNFLIPVVWFFIIDISGDEDSHTSINPQTERETIAIVLIICGIELGTQGKS